MGAKALTTIHSSRITSHASRSHLHYDSVAADPAFAAIGKGDLIVVAVAKLRPVEVIPRQRGDNLASICIGINVYHRLAKEQHLPVSRACPRWSIGARRGHGGFLGVGPYAGVYKPR